MPARFAARFGLLALVLLPLLLPSAHGGTRVLAGWAESARVEPIDLLLPAKLDTGAENSSLHASTIVPFQRNGESWIRFRVGGRRGDSAAFELPLKRMARIKRQGRPSQQRPVAVLRICVGSVRKEVEVNLVDRSGFDYPLLLGRSFLAGDFIVDSSRRDLLAPDCAAAAPRPEAAMH